MPFLVILAIIVYLICIYLFFSFLFIPILLGLQIVSLFWAGFILIRATLDTFKISFPSNWFRSLIVTLSMGTITLISGGQFFRILHNEIETKWFEAITDFIFSCTQYVLVFSPENFIASSLYHQLLVSSSVGLYISDTPFWEISLFVVFLGIARVFLFVFVLGLHKNHWKTHPRNLSSNQPAYINYFFRDAFFDLKGFISSCWEWISNSVLYFCIGPIVAMAEGWILTWPLMLTLAVSSLLPILFMGSTVLLVALGFSLSFALVSFVAVIIAMILRGIEWFLLLIRGIQLVCPSCYKHIAIPTYSCDSCAIEHSELIPGKYGIFVRRCECSKLLPTLFILGRSKLNASCPFCNYSLSKSIGQTQNVHVPLFGGASAGKSSFLIGSYIAIRKQMLDLGGKAFLADSPRNERIRRFIDDYEAGVPILKTRVAPPEAVLIQVHRKYDLDMTDGLVYLYDPGGEVFENSTDLRRHNYLNDTSGLLFLIDPFSLPKIYEKYESQLALVSGEVSPSTVHPQDLFARMVSVLKGFMKTGSNRQFKVPLAVVLTKWDVFDLDDHIPISRNLGNQSAMVRNWMISQADERNLVKGIENTFANVKYFVCSALGNMPGFGSFHPQGVFAPIEWTIRRKRVFK
ncbi:hypothetical protein K8I28_00680 [bacterium]|nr:hypothetical protein [bacterium]